ncbi:MAG: M15 family metallopeptidase [Fusobacteriaceae bacterium]
MIVKYGSKSLINLTKGVDPRLVAFCIELQNHDMPCDLSVFETTRTVAKQKENVAKGVSKTMNSNHIPNSKGIVNAVDLVPYIAGKGNVWEHALYDECLPVWRMVRKYMKLENIIEFGADWKSFVDKPHLEIKKEHRL